MSTVTISPKFQVVIPAAIRESLQLRPGAKLDVVAFNGALRFTPVQPASALRGIARGMDTRLPTEADRPL